MVVLLVPVCTFAPHVRADEFDLHVVPLKGVTSYRLLAMGMDDEGYIWTGSIHRSVHRYDPRTGGIETIQLPYDASTSTCICVGRKVYLLGQTYPKLMVYHRDEKRFTEHTYPSAPGARGAPNVWYGTPPIDGRHLYLFDRGGVGGIKWDTQTDTGAAIPWPYKAPLPGGGRFEPRDGAVYCWVSDVSAALPTYVPLGVARLDVKTDTFTAFHPWPLDDAKLEPYADADDAFFTPFTLKGKLVPFDLKSQRWCKFIDVPRFGERFGFIGLGAEHAGRLYFSISTYDGDEVGCDGKPYHFCNGLLAFDPKAPADRACTFPRLDAQGAYHQVAYTLSANGHFFATGANIRQPDGSLQQAIPRDVVFWQTLKPKD